MPQRQRSKRSLGDAEQPMPDDDGTSTPTNYVLYKMDRSASQLKEDLSELYIRPPMPRIGFIDVDNPAPQTTEARLGQIPILVASSSTATDLSSRGTLSDGTSQRFSLKTTTELPTDLSAVPTCDLYLFIAHDSTEAYQIMHKSLSEIASSDWEAGDKHRSRLHLLAKRILSHAGEFDKDDGARTAGTGMNDVKIDRHLLGNSEAGDLSAHENTQVFRLKSKDVAMLFEPSESGFQLPERQDEAYYAAIVQNYTVHSDDNDEEREWEEEMHRRLGIIA